MVTRIDIALTIVVQLLTTSTVSSDIEATLTPSLAFSLTNVVISEIIFFDY